MNLNRDHLSEKSVQDSWIFSSGLNTVHRVRLDSLSTLLHPSIWYLFQRQDRTHWNHKKCSATGNRTPVSRVTGGDTHHYTIVESYPFPYFSIYSMNYQIECFKRNDLEPNHKCIQTFTIIIISLTRVRKGSVKIWIFFAMKNGLFQTTKIILSKLSRFSPSWTKLLNLISSI